MKRSLNQTQAVNGKQATGSNRPLALLACLVVCAACVSLGCASHPVEETVTTDAGRASALPAGAKPVTREANLPKRDPDIETAGDRIAAAITYLNMRKRERREDALHALSQASVALNRALHNRTEDDAARNSLHDALKNLEAAERAVQRNSTDATRQLSTLNKSLDNLP